MNTTFKKCLETDPSFTIINNVFYQNPTTHIQPFERTYASLRKKEGRLPDDKTVKLLPEVAKHHPQYQEWKIRKRSWDQLARYLRDLPSSHTVLEVGCGNGWMTHGLEGLSKEICAVDVHAYELEQAARLFSSESISFVCGDIFTLPFKEGQFDVVILASSIQYFEDLPRLLRRLTALTRKKGEIHILDSPLYKIAEVAAAKSRTMYYFLEQGEPDMNKYYFHHSIEALEGYDWTVLHRPFEQLVHKLLRTGRHKPFPWIRIKTHGRD